MVGIAGMRRRRTGRGGRIRQWLYLRQGKRRILFIARSARIKAVAEDRGGSRAGLTTVFGWWGLCCSAAAASSFEQQPGSAASSQQQLGINQPNIGS